MGDRIRKFAQALRSRAPLIGTFIKTPSPLVCELLSRARLDLVCLDTEHAAFGACELDGCIAMLRALDQPSLVRIGDCRPADIRAALDCGATGILVPHVTSAQQAGEIVAAARFGEGGRGYSGSTRAADFGGKSMRDHIRDSHGETVIVVQIEDLAALDSVGAIAAVDGIDCVFVGRADLSVALGRQLNDPEVIAAVSRICAAGGASAVAVGMFCSLEEMSRWRAQGASLFLSSSDQSLMLSAARQLAAGFHDRSHEVR